MPLVEPIPGIETDWSHSQEAAASPLRPNRQMPGARPAAGALPTLRAWSILAATATLCVATSNVPTAACSTVGTSTNLRAGVRSPGTELSGDDTRAGERIGVTAASTDRRIPGWQGGQLEQLLPEQLQALNFYDAYLSGAALPAIETDNPDAVMEFLLSMPSTRSRGSGTRPSASLTWLALHGDKRAVEIQRGRRLSSCFDFEQNGDEAGVDCGGAGRRSNADCSSFLCY